MQAAKWMAHAALWDLRLIFLLHARFIFGLALTFAGVLACCCLGGGRCTYAHLHTSSASGQLTKLLGLYELLASEACSSTPQPQPFSRHPMMMMMVHDDELYTVTGL